MFIDNVPPRSLPLQLQKSHVTSISSGLGKYSCNQYMLISRENEQVWREAYMEFGIGLLDIHGGELD